MNIQQIISDITSRADINKDGKLSPQDIDALRDTHGLSQTLVDTLKKAGDANGDGKLDLQDALTHLGGVFGEPKAKTGRKR
ncbi:MAG: hypothetical protein WAQ25_04605 [Candidatus Saccharimonas sp.]